jgi:hypothetical protein
MITLRAIKGTAPSECRYHRYGETYDFCTWRPSRVVTAFAKHQISFKRMLSNLAQSARLTVRAALSPARPVHGLSSAPLKSDQTGCRQRAPDIR